MSKICIPIIPLSLEDALEKIKRYSSEADIIEIWLGELFQEEGLKNKDSILDALFQVKSEVGKIPFLFTLKDEKEQGHFGGTDQEKKELVRDLFSRGADYVDLDYEFDAKNNYDFLHEISSFDKESGLGKTELILSAHFFQGTPSFPSLKNRVQLMKNRGADVVKIAAMPESEKDLITLLRLSENLSRNHVRFIAISMGEIGKISRVLTPLLGGEMMFAPLELSESSAPGQIISSSLREFLHHFSWS